jgi:hypothetical protein
MKTSGTLTAGAVTYPNTSGSANQVLTTNGSGVASWATPSTTATAYSGTLPVVNGGTGATTASTALANLTGTQAANTVLAGPSSSATTLVTYDGSSVTGWTTSGGTTIDNGIGNPGSSFKITGSNQSFYRNFGQSLKNKIIQFDLKLTSGIAGFSVGGVGNIGLRIITGTSSQNGLNGQTTWSYPEFGSNTYTFTANTWYTIKIITDNGVVGGTKWYVNDILVGNSGGYAIGSGTDFGIVTDGATAYYDNITIIDNSNSGATPTFRALVANDIPTLNQNTTGNAATVTTNANLTGVVTSIGNATAIANGVITNTMLANGAVANLSGTNTGDQTNITGNAATATTATNVSGVVAVANGGTGQTTIAGIQGALGLAGTKVAIGATAGATTQGSGAIAIGNASGNLAQGAQSIAIGYVAGQSNQGANSVAIGSNAAQSGQGTQSVAIGLATNSAANNATALGANASAGHTNATALGFQAATTAINTIQLGADGVTVAGSTAITNVKTTGTLTAGTVTYPNAHNSIAGQILTTNGSGVASWATPASSGVPYTGATGAVNLGAYDLKVNGITIGKGNGSLADNIAIGSSPMRSVSGNKNIAIGTEALNALGAGNTNIGIGYTAGYSMTGSSNIAIGHGSNMSGGNSNSIVIGHGVDVTASNTIQLGNSSVTDLKTFGKITSGTITYPNTHNSTAGQILTTNAAGVASWATPASSSGTAHTVGEIYGGGIVFYITPGGFHGLIADTYENGNASNEEALDIVTNPIYHNSTNSGNLYTDWRIPTYYELKLLYNARTTSNLNLTTGTYISCTYTAYSQYKNLKFSDNTIQYENANWVPRTLRAIRSF